MRLRSLLSACVISLLAVPAAVQAKTANAEFEVKIKIEATCSVTASNVNLNTHYTDEVNVSGTSTINVTCSNSTPYSIGLQSTNSGTDDGVGSMKNGGDSVPYQLRTGSVTGNPWGNTAASEGVAGNGVGGTGTGLLIPYTAYVTVANTNYKPGEYKDTVKVNVNF